MKNLAVTLYVKLVLILALTLLSANAKAGLLTLDVDDLDYQVGDTVTVDVVASDFLDVIGFQQYISSFNFDLSFDSSVLGFQTASYGNGLDGGFGLSIQNPIASTTSPISFGELSLLDEIGLFLAQTPSFVLASIEFEILSAGDAALDLLNISMFEGTGLLAQEISSVNVQTANINITDSAEIPVPPTLFLLALPLLFVVRNARR